MMRDTAVSRVKTSAEGYRLTIEGDGFTWQFDPESASEVIDAGAAVAAVIDGNEPFIWPARLVQALQSEPAEGAVKSTEGGEEDVELDDIALPDSFDRDAFLEELGAALDAYNATRTGTFDAAGAYDAEAGMFTLSKARSNQKLDAASIERAALMAISTLDDTVTLDEQSFVPLANGASEEQVQAAIDAANELIGTDVDLKMGGNVVATLDGSTFVQWMTFDENLTPTLSTEPLTAWVHELAVSKLDTIGCERTYTRPDGKSVTVSGGTYGWNSNEAELVKLLQDAVANKQVGGGRRSHLAKRRNVDGQGRARLGAYCDIDLTEQHVRYYDAAGTLMWESGCVTGNPNEGDATPTGVYLLNAKRQNETLIGFDEDKDGEPDYKSPVAYWMPFCGQRDRPARRDVAARGLLLQSSGVYLGGKPRLRQPALDKAAELYNPDPGGRLRDRARVGGVAAGDRGYVSDTYTGGRRQISLRRPPVCNGTSVGRHFTRAFRLTGGGISVPLDDSPLTSTSRNGRRRFGRSARRRCLPARSRAGSREARAPRRASSSPSRRTARESGHLRVRAALR